MSQTDPSTLTVVSGWGRVAATIAPHVEQILDLWVDGMSMRQIVEQLRLPVTASQCRGALFQNWTDQFEQARRDRADELMERNGEHAANAAATGEPSGYKAAADINFKLAAQLDPVRYGDKKTVALTGPDGGAVKVEADVTLSPDEAYKRMLKGADQ